MIWRNMNVLSAVISMMKQMAFQKQVLHGYNMDGFAGGLDLPPLRS